MLFKRTGMEIEMANYSFKSFNYCKRSEDLGRIGGQIAPLVDFDKVFPPNFPPNSKQALIKERLWNG